MELRDHIKIIVATILIIIILVIGEDRNKNEWCDLNEGGLVRGADQLEGKPGALEDDEGGFTKIVLKGLPVVWKG